jgi:hypothetical protein
MAYEIDGHGNILVHVFTVCYTDTDGAECGTQTRCFTDHTEGWNWTREAGAEWEGVDASNRYTVEYSNEWVEYTENTLRAFCEAREFEDNEAPALLAEGWD